MANSAEFETDQTWIIGPYTTDEDPGAEPGIYIVGQDAEIVAIVKDSKLVHAALNARLIAVAPTAVALIRDMYMMLTTAPEGTRIERDTCWHGSMRRLLAWVDEAPTSSSPP